MKISFWSYMYSCTLLFAMTILLLQTGCATCPGAKNLAYPQFYKAQDLMKYELSEKCMISKTDSCKFNGQEWVGIINQTDDIIFTFKDDDLNYFRLEHHGTNEQMYELFGKYIQFFDLYGSNYKYTAGYNFTCDYLNWKVACNLSSGSLQVVARKGATPTP